VTTSGLNSSRKIKFELDGEDFPTGLPNPVLGADPELDPDLGADPEPEDGNPEPHGSLNIEALLKQLDGDSSEKEKQIKEKQMLHDSLELFLKEVTGKCENAQGQLNAARERFEIIEKQTEAYRTLEAQNVLKMGSLNRLESQAHELEANLARQKESHDKNMEELRAANAKRQTEVSEAKELKKNLEEQVACAKSANFALSKEKKQLEKENALLQKDIQNGQNAGVRARRLDAKDFYAENAATRNLCYICNRDFNDIDTDSNVSCIKCDKCHVWVCILCINSENIDVESKWFCSMCEN